MAAKKKIPTALRDLIIARDGGGFACVYCTRGGDMHVDHVIAESEGGPTEPGNLVTACTDCNMRKGVIDLDLFCMFLARRGLGGAGPATIEARVRRQLAIPVPWPPK